MIPVKCLILWCRARFANINNVYVYTYVHRRIDKLCYGVRNPCVDEPLQVFSIGQCAFCSCSVVLFVSISSLALCKCVQIR